MPHVFNGEVAVSRLAFLGPLAIAAWAIAAACGTSEPPLTPEQAVGRDLYIQYCRDCHGGAKGGKLTDIPPPHNTNGHTWHHPDQQLIDITLNGLALKAPGQPEMIAFKDKLDAAQVKAILAYIKVWWTPEQREWQAKVTAQSN